MTEKELRQLISILLSEIDFQTDMRQDWTQTASQLRVDLVEADDKLTAAHETIRTLNSTIVDLTSLSQLNLTMFRDANNKLVDTKKRYEFSIEQLNQSGDAVRVQEKKVTKLRDNLYKVNDLLADEKEMVRELEKEIGRLTTDLDRSYECFQIVDKARGVLSEAIRSLREDNAEYI